jgi:hypothetical protein
MGRVLGKLFALALMLTIVLTPFEAAADRCSMLDRATLDQSLALGTRFLLNNQRPEGNFQYQYDWRTKRDAVADSPVRQAGAAWGLSLIHHETRDTKVGRGLKKALRFFRSHTKTRPDGALYIAYPGAERGDLGTVALLALAHIELWRSGDSSTRAELDGYLRFLVTARIDSGGFHANYDAHGKLKGSPSPYYDGEALLALVKAARYLGRDDLRLIALREAEASHQRNVRRALAAHPDSPITKGYFQWAAMAYFELATWTATSHERRHADRLLALADWMTDVHRTLQRRRNTAYAYEGIVPAYAIAKQRGEQARMRKYGCTIERGMHKLTSWQVGSRIANRYIRAQPTDDARAIGGVQNHRREAGLRIDVTQHQMHAVILARRHYFK